MTQRDLDERSGSHRRDPDPGSQGSPGSPGSTRRPGESKQGSGREAPLPEELSDEDRPREAELDEAFDRIIIEGRPRLYRRWPELLSTAFVAGMEVALGVLAMFVVESQTGSRLLGGIAFSVGFRALQLGHSELFTEGFLVPVTVVAAREASWRHLVRFWFGTLLGNLAGGWLMTLVVMTAYPELADTARTAGDYYIGGGFTYRTFSLAVLAGAAITLMTRMQRGTENDVARAIASIAAAFLLAGLGLFHSILDSLVAFSALHAGGASFGYGDWAEWLGWVVMGNMAGGIGLTTMLRMIRSQRRLREIRQHPPDLDADTPAGRERRERQEREEAGPGMQPAQQ